MPAITAVELSHILTTEKDYKLGSTVDTGDADSARQGDEIRGYSAEVRKIRDVFGTFIAVFSAPNADGQPNDQAAVDILQDIAGGGTAASSLMGLDTRISELIDHFYTQISTTQPLDEALEKDMVMWFDFAVFYTLETQKKTLTPDQLTVLNKLKSGDYDLVAQADGTQVFSPADRAELEPVLADMEGGYMGDHSYCRFSINHAPFILAAAKHIKEHPDMSTYTEQYLSTIAPVLEQIVRLRHIAYHATARVNEDDPLFDDSEKAYLGIRDVADITDDVTQRWIGELFNVLDRAGIDRTQELRTDLARLTERYTRDVSEAMEEGRDEGYQEGLHEGYVSGRSASRLTTRAWYWLYNNIPTASGIANALGLGALYRKAASRWHGVGKKRLPVNLQVEKDQLDTDYKNALLIAQVDVDIADNNVKAGLSPSSALKEAQSKSKEVVRQAKITLAYGLIGVYARA
jgi:hypothetical protein